MTLEAYSNITTEDFQSSFLLTSIRLKHTTPSTDFLTRELEKTRFHFESLESSFYTLGELNNINLNLLSKCWLIIKELLADFPRKDPDYNLIETKLIGNNITEDHPKILSTLRKLIEISRKTLLSNIAANKQSENKKLGTIGELLLYLHERDINRSECIFHKLIPDNAIMPRHGMDLLSVQFGNEPKYDVVRFMEAKGTIHHFEDRCKEIITWFNNDIEQHVSMVIEGARMEWQKRYTEQIFRRASSALSRFQADVKNYKFIGSVLIDSNSFPAPNKISKFDEIGVNKDNKHLILFSTEKLQQMIEEVFNNTC